MNIDKHFEKRKKKTRLRDLKKIERSGNLTIFYEGKRFIDFSSNNYLGLANHRSIIKSSQEMTEKYGTGATSSRLVSGNLHLFEEVEKKIAVFKHTEDALIFNNGYQANISILPVLADRFSLILMDKLSHHSLLMGGMHSKAKLLRYRHNDYEHLGLLLDKYHKKFSDIFIVTEAVFSMDGDRCDVDLLLSLADRYNAFIYIDEAHAIGILGKKGIGICSGKEKINLFMGTFGKAFGSFGAYVATTKKIKNYLINFCPGFIYTTALPPAVLGAIDAALDLIPMLDKKRQALFEKVKEVKINFLKQGWKLTDTDSAIIPVIIREEKKALKLYKKLLEENIYAIAIRPPTVPENSSRIRFTISSDHSQNELYHLIQVMKKLRNDYGKS